MLPHTRLPRQLHPRTKALLVGLLVVHIAGTMVAWHSAWPLGFDARSYFAAAQAIIDHRPLIDLSQPELLGWGSADDTPPYLYPPLLAFLLTPLTLLPPIIATAVWLGIVLITSLLLIPLLRPFLGWRTAIVAVLLFLPTWKSIGMGQINALIAVLYTFALLSMQRREIVRAGIWLMIGVLFKLVPAVGLLVLAARRSWRSLIVAALVGGVMFALSLPFVSIAAWRDGVLAAVILPWRLRSMLSWPGQAGYWLGDLGVMLGYAITATLLVITLLRAPKIPPLLALSAAIILPLLIARVTWDHHALMALPALAVLWHWSTRGRMLAGSTWLLLTTINDITMPVMLTLCWIACCWPHLLGNTNVGIGVDGMPAQPPQPQHVL